jgi:hypothetical protein
MIGAKSSNSLRINWWCTGRHMGDLRNVHNTAIRRTLGPSRPCGSVTTDAPCKP